MAESGENHLWQIIIKKIKSENGVVIMEDEIIVMWIELFAGIWVWSWIASLASFIIGGILFLFSKLLKENFFLSVCALIFMRISEVLLYIGSAAAILMIIPAIPGILEQLHEMYLKVAQ